MDITKKSQLFLETIKNEWIRDMVLDGDGYNARDCGVFSNVLKSFASNISSYGFDEGEVFEVVGFCLVALVGSEHKTDTIKDEMCQKLKEILELVVNKNHDYGDSVFRVPCCTPNTSIETAVLVRLSDKFQRYWSLTDHKLNLVDESIEDTVKDIVGYLFLYWCLKWSEE